MLEPLVPDVVSRSSRGMVRRDERHDQRPRAHGGRDARRATMPASVERVARRTSTSSARCNERIMRMPRSPSAAGCPGSRRSAPSCSRPARVLLRRPLLDLFDVDDDDDQRLGAARGHRARRRASRTIPTTGPTIRARCAAPRSRASRAGADPTHEHTRARRPARAAAVRPDAVAARARCRRPGDARVRGDAARHRSARLAARATTGTRRTSSRTPQLRGFSPDEVEFLAALVRHHRRGEPEAVRTALRCARARIACERVAQARGAAARRRRSRPRAARRRRGSDVRTRGRPRGAATRRARRRRTGALGCAPPARPVREGLRRELELQIAALRRRRAHTAE